MSPASVERLAGAHGVAPDPAVRASVVVPAFQASATIEGCLRSLDTQTLDARAYEVIVVDDGSTDDTAAIVERVAATARTAVRLIRLPVNRGPAAARNAGIAVASGAVVAFTDADCRVAPDWLERGLARLASDGALAAVEGRTDPTGPVGTLTHQMRNLTGGLFMTCNMLYRREALAAAGGFDERFRLAFLEDSDVAFAVQDGGGRIAFAPEVIVDHLVLHEGRRKFWRDARKRFFNPLLYRKHPRRYLEQLRPVVPGLPPIHLQYMAWTVAPLAVAIAGLPLLAAAGVVPWAFWLRRLAHAYRARDLVSIAQVCVVPFVQTFWVLAGAVRFRAFSPRL